MARLIVFGVVASGRERAEWRATQLHVAGGGWGVEHYHAPGWVGHYLDLGALKLQKFVENLSVRQKRLTNDQIWDLVTTDAESLASSGAMEAFESDLRLFGNAAFQQPLANAAHTG